MSKLILMEIDMSKGVGEHFTFPYLSVITDRIYGWKLVAVAYCIWFIFRFSPRLGHTDN